MYNKLSVTLEFLPISDILSAQWTISRKFQVEAYSGNYWYSQELIGFNQEDIGLD